MKKILLILTFLLASCHTVVDYDDLHTAQSPNTHLLPALKTKVNTSNLRAAFTDVEKGGISKNERDIIVDDAVNLFESEVENNITVGEGAKKGYISFRIQYVEFGHSFALRAASLCTLGLINLTGFPFDRYSQTMEVKVEIADKKQGVVKRYVETVESEAYRALYWGYSRKIINRKISAENVKKALAKIRAEINADAPEIAKKLN